MKRKFEVENLYYFIPLLHIYITLLTLHCITITLHYTEFTCLKYKRITASGCKYLRIRIFEFEDNIQFHLIIVSNSSLFISYDLSKLGNLFKKLDLLFEYL